MWLSAQQGRPVLLALLIAAILINIVQFNRIDRHLNVFGRAIYRFDTPDIVVLALRLKNAWNTLNLYGTLRQIAPDVTLIVPAKRRLSGSFIGGVVGLSRVMLIEDRNAPLADPRNFSGSIVAQGEVWSSPKQARVGKPGKRWAIAVGPCPVREMILLRSDEFDYFLLDRSLQQGGALSCDSVR